MYYYIKSETNLWTVGCQHGTEWNPESDWNSTELAAHRVAWLNGGANGKAWNEFIKDLNQK